MPTTAPAATPAQVETLMVRAFFIGRPARSTAYIAGVRAKLRRALLGERLECPYPQGSAEFDAFFAGVTEGSAIYGEAVAREAGE